LFISKFKGIYPPTSGTASILGFDIVRDMDEIRSSLGFCPQHDILYEDLNVKEHLEVVALVDILSFE
jgi:ATP-binding cassette subfamily A (ABC1) protein 3